MLTAFITFGFITTKHICDQLVPSCCHLSCWTPFFCWTSVTFAFTLVYYVSFPFFVPAQPVASTIDAVSKHNLSWFDENYGREKLQTLQKKGFSINDGTCVVGLCFVFVPIFITHSFLKHTHTQTHSHSVPK